jgi:hypothetical protein
LKLKSIEEKHEKHHKKQTEKKQFLKAGKDEYEKLC